MVLIERVVRLALIKSPSQLLNLQYYFPKLSLGFEAEVGFPDGIEGEFGVYHGFQAPGEDVTQNMVQFGEGPHVRAREYQLFSE